MKKRKHATLESLRLTNPQKSAVQGLLTNQKNKYKKLLHETHERLHILADLSPCVEVWINIDGHVEYVNPACEAVTGYEPSELLEGRIMLEQLVHPVHRRRYLRDRTRSLHGGAGERAEYLLVRADGDVRWVDVAWKPVVTRRNRQIGVRISIFDVTLYRAAAAHCASLLADVAAGAPVPAVVRVEGEGAIVQWPDGAAALTGVPADRALGRRFTELLVDETGDAAPSADIAAGDFAARIVREDGTALRLHVFMVPDGGGDAGSGAFYCILTPARDAHQ